MNSSCTCMGLQKISISGNLYWCEKCVAAPSGGKLTTAEEELPEIVDQGQPGFAPGHPGVVFTKQRPVARDNPWGDIRLHTSVPSGISPGGEFARNQFVRRSAVVHHTAGGGNIAASTPIAMADAVEETPRYREVRHTSGNLVGVTDNLTGQFIRHPGVCGHCSSFDTEIRRPIPGYDVLHWDFVYDGHDDAVIGVYNFVEGHEPDERPAYLFCTQCSERTEITIPIEGY